MTVEHKIPKNDQDLFLAMVTMVVLYAWLTLFATILNIFYAPAIWVIWSIGCAVLWYKKAITFSRPSTDLTYHVVIGAVFTLLIAFYTTPTIFAGRDQGSLAEAAMQLPAYHQLIHHSPESDAFFDIYGRGKALNFPGFYYTPDGGLLTQFPLPYISFLGGFYGILGLTGLTVGNMILLFSFLVTITFTARFFLDRKNTIIFLALILSSFSIGWFAKFTLSENLAGTLLWMGLTLYLILAQHTNKKTFFVLFATMSLLLFSRIEGIWFFLFFCILLLTSKSVRPWIREDLWNRAFVPCTILLAVGILITIMNIPFVITMAHALFDSPTTSILKTPAIEKMLWLFAIYGLYGLLVPLCVSVAAIILFLRKKISARALLPLLIVLPLFLYYLFPHISSDHPWMLRRFTYALVPATVLTSMIVVTYMASYTRVRTWTRYTIPVIILMCNIPAFIWFFAYTENTTLLPQVSALASHLTETDLILIDNTAAGNGWSMITTPLRALHNLHAVYFFNPADLTRLSTDAFERTILIVPDTKIDFYTDHFAEIMHPLHTYSFHTTQLDLSNTKHFPPSFPQKKDVTITGVVYELK